MRGRGETSPRLPSRIPKSHYFHLLSLLLIFYEDGRACYVFGEDSSEIKPFPLRRGPSRCLSLAESATPSLKRRGDEPVSLRRRARGVEVGGERRRDKLHKEKKRLDGG